MLQCCGQKCEQFLRRKIFHEIIYWLGILSSFIFILITTFFFPFQRKPVQKLAQQECHFLYWCPFSCLQLLLCFWYIKIFLSLVSKYTKKNIQKMSKALKWIKSLTNFKQHNCHDCISALMVCSKFILTLSLNTSFQICLLIFCAWFFQLFSSKASF